MPQRRVHLSAVERKRIKAWTAGRCHVCGRPLRGMWTVDHVRPLARGGANRENNYLACCGVCNDARWHRRSRSIRKILQMGVYLLPEISKATPLGR
jgi:5-methylcytosine-specific restriction endonuclease McrA